MLRPASWLSFVTWSTLRCDVQAGLTGATLVLPQAVAFATIAGLPPQYGLYTAIVTPIVAALFGSSMIMVSGPTTAISAIVLSSLSGIAPVGSADFISLAILLAVLVGFIQVSVSLLGLGKLMDFVSHSVMLGFTAAAAALIFASQLGPSLGFAVHGENIHQRLTQIFSSIDQVNTFELQIALITLLSALIAKRVSRQLPYYLIALLIGGMYAFFANVTGQAISTVGALPSLFPKFGMPDISIANLGRIFEAAFAIAVVASLEAVAIGRAFAPKTNSRFDSNKEVFGQGLSNIVGGFFGAYPGSGSFTRSGVNVASGAKTPLSAIFSSVFLVLCLVIFVPLFAYIPLSALAGVILHVAWNLISFKEMRSIFKADVKEAGIIAVTFIAGVSIGLELAILVGVLASLGLFLSKSAHPTLAIIVPDHERVFRNVQVFKLPQCKQAIFVRLDGPLYFGSVEAVELGFHNLREAYGEQKHLILVLKGVGDVDLAGGHCLINEAIARQKIGGSFSIVARYQPLLKRLGQIGVIKAIGDEHIYPSKSVAIKKFYYEADVDICNGCSTRVFKECRL